MTLVIKCCFIANTGFFLIRKPSRLIKLQKGSTKGKLKAIPFFPSAIFSFDGSKSCSLSLKWTRYPLAEQTLINYKRSSGFYICLSFKLLIKPYKEFLT